MVELKSGWEVKGTYNEACASEGPCPYYFGRDRIGGCRYFMVFRIKEGKVNNVDLAGVTVIYAGDIPHPGFKELLEIGSEGMIYISDKATPEQREVLDTLVVKSLGAALMKKVFDVKYVKIDVADDGKTVSFDMDKYGKMKQSLSTGQDGKNPVKLDNQSLPFLTDVKCCHSDYWTIEDQNRHFDYKDRCGVWADFVFNG